MADKAISQLLSATQVGPTDLFVLEQDGAAKKLSGQTLTAFLLELAQGHGGITNIAKTKTSGLVDTYTITMADTSTTTFTVTNGAKGDKGDNTYTWVKYSSSQPSKNSDMYDTPDNYMGIYTGPSSTAPTSYSSYEWFKIKGEKGETGDPAVMVSQSVMYQVSTSGTVAPDGGWMESLPSVPQGQFLWTRSMMQFNTGAVQTSYSVTRFGLDGNGAVNTVNRKDPDSNGNIDLTASDVGARANNWTPTAAEVGAIPNVYGAVTAQHIAPGAISKVFNVTLPTEGWTQYVNYAVLTFDSPGPSSEDRTVVDLDLTGKTGATVVTLDEEWSKILRAGVDTQGKFYVYSSEIPTVEIPIKIMVIHGAGKGGTGDTGGGTGGGTSTGTGAVTGRAEAFVFEVSGDAENGYTSTASYDAILAAYNSGQVINCKANVYDDEVICQLFLVDDEGLLFSAVCANLCVIVDIKPTEVTLELAQVGSGGSGDSAPVRGIDYWTEADKAEIKSYVDEAILGGAW